MKFWQKTYILTLLLFLVCLNAGIFALTYYTYGENVQAAEDVCRAEQTYISKSFERDLETLLSSGSGASPYLLMASYTNHYGKQGIRLAFSKDGVWEYGSFSGEVLYETDAIVHRVLDEKRHILIESAIGESGYRLVFGKDVSELDTTFRRLMAVFVSVAAAVSVFLAVCLFFILKKLSVPLEKLRKTTETIASGELSMTADEKGGDEVADLAKSFNVMVGKLRGQMEMLERDAYRKQMLVDNMAHELRTPLTGIRGYAEYIEKAAASEEVKIDAARCIVSEAARLQKISEKILDTAYLREGTVVREETDLAELLADTAVRLAFRAEQAGVSLVLQTEKAVVQGDATLLSMLFYNLTENAVKAGSTTVTLSCKGNTAVVADDGRGMTAEQLLHITEPFYRTDKSRSRAEGGAGLGLALCRQIVLSHGGDMHFESDVGKGTAATVVFCRRASDKQKGVTG